MKKLEIQEHDGFLDLEDLPHNCIFNKVVTGCGGTTIALKNGDNLCDCSSYHRINRKQVLST